MQEDEDLELRDKGRTWDGELSDSDSEENDLRRRNQGVMASEAAFARSVPLHRRSSVSDSSGASGGVSMCCTIVMHVDNSCEVIVLVDGVYFPQSPYF